MTECTVYLGIVTHMTLKAYPAGMVWGGTISYNESHQDALMNAFAEYQHVGQLDQSTATITYMFINNGTLAVTLVCFGSVPALFSDLVLSSRSMIFLLFLT